MNKFIESKQVSDWEVLTENGFVPITHSHKTIPFQKYGIKTKTKSLYGADHHLLFRENNSTVRIEDLKIGDRIKTIDGIEEVIELSISQDWENMYDITVDSDEHSFYSNGILSHNTTLLTIFALWYVMFQKDKNLYLVANKLDTAKQVFDRVRMAYEMMQPWLKAGIKDGYGKEGFTLGNGSGIRIAATTDNTGRGDSINLLLVDEAAFIPKEVEEKFFKSIIPTITQSETSKILLISTANGKNNKFYEIFNKSLNEEENPELLEEGDERWKAVRIDWWEIERKGYKTPEAFKRSMIKILGSEEAFNQEYGNEFLEEGGTTKIFSDDKLKKFEELSKDNPPQLLLKNGLYKVWKKPVAGHFYSIGVDCSEGVGKHNSVAVVLDVTNPLEVEHVATFADNKHIPAEFANVLMEMCGQWGNPPILIEYNNVGQSVINSLENAHKYHRIVSYFPKAGKNLSVDRRKGIYSHTNSKMNSVGNVRYYEKAYKGFKTYDPKLISELHDFVKHPNGAWKRIVDERGGTMVNDDHVDALLWAYFILHEDIIEDYYNVEQKDTSGKAVKIYDPSSDRVIRKDSDFADMVVFATKNDDVYDDNLEQLLGSGWTFV